MARRMSGPWNHRKCAEHRKIEGYTKKVCVLPGQDPEQIYRFAEVMYRLAVAFKRTIPKPATTRRQFNMHDVCGGHFSFPGMGKVCYGHRGMQAWELGAAQDEARKFAKEIGEIRANNPRYARFHTEDFWR